jgi:hypothetical protein
MRARDTRSDRRAVLVTGANRSGTTWVGRMLCASRALAYVHEPFNPSTWPTQFQDAPLPRNVYVCADNEQRYAAAARRIVEGRAVPLVPNLRAVRTPRRAAALARELARAAGRRAARRPALVKDPIALFSAEWLAQRFGVHVVVCVRNPVAYAGSIKRLDWRFDFSNWLRQPLLLRDLLGPYEDEMRTIVSASAPDLVDEAVLQWNCSYHAADVFRSRHPEWVFVEHDALAEDPVAGFGAVYERLGLRYDARAVAAVRRATDAGNVKDAPVGRRGPVRRDSRAARHTWRARLTDEEVERVRAGTRAVAARFYTADADWAR